MRAVPHMDFPSLEDLEKYKDAIPGYAEMVSVIRAESQKGNIVIHIADAAGLPQETVVMVDFAYEPKCDYERIKVHRLGDGKVYKYLIMDDRKGSLELAFGAWKYRMKEELALKMQEQIDNSRRRG